MAIFGILSGICGVVSLVVFIMVLIRIFKDKEKNGVLHGIIGIVTCGLWAFIWGWVRHASLEIKTHMIIWSACIGINIVIQILMITMAATPMP